MKKLLVTLALTLCLNGCLTMAVGTACAVGSAWGGDSDCSGEILDAAWDADKRIIRAMVADGDPEDAAWVPVSVQGVVTAEGDPVLSARVELASVGFGPLALVSTDSEGSYEIREIRIDPGECDQMTLIITHPDKRPAHTITVECGEQRVDFDFPRG